MGRDRLVKRALRERFVLTMQSGETFEGLLLDADDMTIRVTDAYALDGSARISVDGDLYLPRFELAYMQRPAAG
jgi:hypothetical protein